MNTLRLAAPLLLSLALFLCANSNAADNKAVAASRTIAEIMIGLHHYPTDAEKVTLRQLETAETSSANEKVIAQALASLQHKVADADRPKLEAITRNESATGAERALANILLNLNHQPSDGDISVLKHITH